MRILITGGAGYIGSVLTPALLARGFHVTVLDTFSEGYPFLAHCCLDPNFQPVAGDTRDMRVVEPLLREADIVIPLAALVGAPLCARDQVGATSLNRDAVVDIMKHVSAGQRGVYPTTQHG